MNLASKTVQIIAAVSVFALMGLMAVLFVAAGQSTVSVDISGDLLGDGSGDYIVFSEQSSSGGLDPNGFPTTERELASFNRAATSSFQNIQFQRDGGGSGQGDPSGSPYRSVNLTSAESLLRADIPSADLDVNDIVTGSGPKAAPASQYPRGSNGVFHVACNVSHFAYDDPIALPGQPGKAHLHMFFGNTQANAYSDTDSIVNKGNSSCQHEELNRTAYWTPALLDGDDHALVPDYIQVYYESFGSKHGANFQNFPEGLNFISGDAFATQPQSDIGLRGASFFCGWYSKAEQTGPSSVPAGNKGQTIPYCDPAKYSHMQVNLGTPFCWDGVNLDWKKDQPNVVYPVNLANRGPCPASHPVMLPNLYYRMTFDIRNTPTRTNTWYLSSDVDRATGERRGPAGSSLHADWWNGWNQPLLDSIFDNCIDQDNVWCGPVHLGDGRLTDHIAKVTGVDDERISPDDILTACPLRSAYDGNPRNVAYCIN